MISRCNEMSFIRCTLGDNSDVDCDGTGDSNNDIDEGLKDDIYDDDNVFFDDNIDLYP